MENLDFNRLVDLASVGSVDAAIQLSNFYVQNNNYNDAFIVIKKLENLNNVEIYKKLANFYEKGIGINIDINKAKEYYQKAFELGNIESSFNLSLIYYREKEYNFCIKYLQTGASNNHLQSMLMLAEFYYKGIAVIKDLEIALNFYNKIYQLYGTKYAFYLGKILFELKKYDEAFSILKESYIFNDYRSCFYLANCYFLGFGTIKQIERGIEILTIGSNNNDILSLIELANLYEKGIYVNKDIEKSNFYKNAANKIRSKYKK